MNRVPSTVRCGTRDINKKHVITEREIERERDMGDTPEMNRLPSTVRCGTREINKKHVITEREREIFTRDEQNALQSEMWH